jgi:hypothetical protein
MQLSPGQCNAIKNALEIDVDFLKSQRFMDYSLLFAIRAVNLKKKDESIEITMLNDIEEQNFDEENETSKSVGNFDNLMA